MRGACGRGLDSQRRQVWSLRCSVAEWEPRGMSFRAFLRVCTGAESSSMTARYRLRTRSAARGAAATSTTINSLRHRLCGGFAAARTFSRCSPRHIALSRRGWRGRGDAGRSNADLASRILQSISVAGGQAVIVPAAALGSLDAFMPLYPVLYRISSGT